MHGHGILITELSNGFIVSIPMSHKGNEFFDQGYGMATGFAVKQNEDEVLNKLKDNQEEPELIFQRSSLIRQGEYCFSSADKVSTFIGELLNGNDLATALDVVELMDGIK